MAREDLRAVHLALTDLAAEKRRLMRHPALVEKRARTGLSVTAGMPGRRGVVPLAAVLCYGGSIAFVIWGVARLIGWA